jgi:uncharacterized protein (DUF433 family)
MLTDDRLIERHITDEPTADPRKRNEPVITRTGTPVWVVVAYCQQARQGSVEMTARDYALTEDEVRAALAYYHQHPELDVRKGEGTDSASGSVLG